MSQPRRSGHGSDLGPNEHGNSRVVGLPGAAAAPGRFRRGAQRQGPDAYRGDTENILGYSIATESLAALVERSLSWIAAGERGRYFVCANPHSLEAARRRPSFAQAIREADFVVPDGVGVVLASRLLGGVIRRRITGTDLFRAINEGLDTQGGRRCFFLGSTSRNLDAIRRRMAIEYPRIAVVGSYSPPFRQEFSAAESREMVAAVNAARPDVLWVGMTAPKQETWIRGHRNELDAQFIGPVGAVFDFFTGNAPRSAPWFLDHGLEWLPRLLRQPRRLWRRNFVSNPAFLLRVLRQRAARGLGVADGSAQ
jgi:N-acetylglucosaminyldiphosphoundecaprenol N-acetyl-beta-D-mannosaminyltransferase